MPVSYKRHKIKQVKALPNNTSICVYYSYNNREVKLPTGVTISNKKNAKGEFIDWDYRLNMVKPSVTNFIDKKRRIEELVSRCNDIILRYFNEKRELTIDKLKQELARKNAFEIIKETADLIVLFNLFHQSKAEHFLAGGSIISLKDYTSTRNLLIDYQKYDSHPLYVHDFNSTLFRDLYTFMRINHIDNKEIGIEYITRGKMNPKTCKKRFDILVQFAEYLKESALIESKIVDELKKFRRIYIKVPKAEKVTMEVNEIYAIYDFEYGKYQHRKIIDAFVFLSLTGIRYKDYIHFDKRFIKANADGLPIYDRKASKTRNSSGINYRVPLCNTAIEILEKYNYQLPIISKPNELIKEALAETGLFNDITNIVDSKTGLEKQRYACITMHKARDIFITNLVDTTPLNTLMKYTGHSKLSTLQGYIDTSRNVETKFIELAFKRD